MATLQSESPLKSGHCISPLSVEYRLWGARQAFSPPLSPHELSGEKKREFQDEVLFCGMNVCLK